MSPRDKRSRSVTDSDDEPIRKTYKSIPATTKVSGSSLMGDTPLHFAVKNRSKEHVEFLLQQPECREWLNQRNEFGDTPVHIAVCKADFAIFSLLVEAGAALIVMNNVDQSPLDLANIILRMAQSDSNADLAKHSSEYENALKIHAILNSQTQTTRQLNGKDDTARQAQPINATPRLSKIIGGPLHTPVTKQNAENDLLTRASKSRHYQ